MTTTADSASTSLRSSTPTPSVLRALVIDYLIQNSYTSTAQAFAQESLVRHLDADGDDLVRPQREGDSVELSDELLAQAGFRRDIQSDILSGRVDQAITQLRDRFPSVLDPSSATPTKTEAETSNKPTSGSSPPTLHTLTPFTVDPTRLYLEMRILAFIEAARTVPLERPSSSDNPVPAGAPESQPIDPDTHLASLLQHVFELHDSVKSLSDATDREEYEDELSRVSQLIAHKVPENSPVAKYLQQSRRETVAKQINCAMLYRSGHSPISTLELCMRQTYSVWGYMHEAGYRLPLSTSIPQGLRLPFLKKDITQQTKTTNRNGDDMGAIPPFDLEQFISS